ncbi:MAG: gliding motility protein GldL [Marinirhabdus sp.]
MAQSKSSKRLFNLAYGLGASIVILGALFKILHWEINLGAFILDGGTLLAVGLITEAIIFAISAFEPVEEDLDWSIVYPELSGGTANNRKQGIETQDAEAQLSKKLDKMLKDARIDSELMNGLTSSIRNFESAAKTMMPTEETMSSTKKYGEEIALAAAQMESLNSLYKVQVESTGRQTEAHELVTQNAEQLKAQMENLTTNLSSLNGVYGGMLSAMNRN